MPIYDFECAKGHKHSHIFKMGQAPHAVHCSKCFNGMDAARRVFNVPNLIARPVALRDENRMYGGLSATDTLAEQKAEDVRYEKTWEQVGPGMEAEPEPDLGPSFYDA